MARRMAQRVVSAGTELRAVRWLALMMLVATSGCSGRDRALTDGGPGGGDAGPGGGDAGDFDAGDLDDAGGGGMDGGAAIPIPDPGTGMADWGFSVFPGMPCCRTPDEAYAVGVVTANPGYVQGDIDPAVGDFFYVFRTGPAFTEFTWPGGPNTEEIHLHDGAGGVFGAEITPSAITATTGTWTVMPDHVYVLHLESSMGGFF